MTRALLARWGRRFAIVAGVVSVALLLFGALLVATPVGTRLALSFGLSRAPIAVSVGSVDGALRGPLTLRDVDVDHLGARVHVDRLVVDWRVLSLLRRRVEVDSLQVTGVTAFVPATFPPNSDETMSEPREGPPTLPDLPVEVLLAGVIVEVDRVEMEGRGETLQAQVTLEGSLEDFELSFEVGAEGDPIEELRARGTVRGAADDYRVSLLGDFVTTGLPGVDLGLEASGSLTGASIAEARVETESGFATLAADVSWYPGITWSLNTTAELLDVAALTPDPEQWPGNVSFRVQSEGRIDDEGVVASARVEGLEGTLRGEALRGAMDAAVLSSNVEIEELELQWGSIDVSAHGFVLDTAALELSIDIPDLGQVVPGARGQILVEADVTGTRARPRVVATFDVDDVAVDSIGARRVIGEVDVDLGAEASSRIRASMLGISAGTTTVDSAAFLMDGTRDEHEVEVGAWLTGLGVRLAGTGTLHLPEATDSLEAPAWSGLFDSLALDTEVVGAWQLGSPFQLHASADSASLSTACLTQGQSEVCVRGGRDFEGTIAGDARVDHFSLAAISVALPNGISVSGRADAVAAFVLGPDGTVRATAEATTEGTVAAPAGADSARFTFGGDGVRLVVDGTGARGEGAFAILSEREGGLFDFSAEGRLPGFTSAGAPLVEQEVVGEIHVESRSGTIGVPSARGTLQLDDGVVHASSVGVFMREMAITVQADEAGGITLEGSARSGEGSLRLDGQVTGSREHPRVAGTFDVVDIVLDSIGVRRATGAVDVDLGDGAMSRIEARVEGVSAGATTVDSATMVVDGTLDAHDLRVGVWLPGVGVVLAGSGELSLPDSAVSTLAWGSRIDGLDLDTDAAGAWQLSAPFDLYASADSASLSPTCLTQGESEVCAQGGRDLEGTLTGDARIERFSLAALSNALPTGTSLVGRLDAQATFVLDAGGTLRGASEVATEGTIAAPAGADTARFTFGGEGLRVVVDGAGARGEGALTLRSDRGGGVFDLAVDGELPGFSSVREPLADQELIGALRVESQDLAFLAAFVPLVDSLGGRFSLDATGSGTIGTPAVRGGLRLDEGAIHAPAAGVSVHDITLTAQADETRGIALEGSARSGEGSLRLEGRTVLEPSPEVPSTLTIIGERFRAVNTSQFRVDIAPDLTVRYDGATVVVNGQVAVPWARIELLDVPPTAIAPSDDVVIVDEEPIVPPDVDATVRILVGNDVRFSGLGFTSFIEGDVRVREIPGATPTVLGELRLVDGRYRAYGQDLVIDRGRVSFAGSAEDAALDVLAVRTASDGTLAGLEVAGEVTRPEVTLTSDPAMPDADVLSYILYGKPLSDGSSTEQTQVAGAAATLGANVITTRLAAQVGLDDARIEGATRDQAELVAGKYLTPSVYVSYGVGLFKPSNTFRIKYLLNSNWALRAESGDANGGDILYQIERGR
jgi:autotransporter translocation and assembly factor TamB